MLHLPHRIFLNELKASTHGWLEIGVAIRKSIVDNTVIGWNVSALSDIRKPYTINRLRNLIEKTSLPLMIEDKNYLSKHFQIMIL